MKSLIVLVMVALTGCGPQYKPKSENAGEIFSLPEELRDCTVTGLTNAYGSYYTVIRCPNSSTTTKSNAKNGQTVTVTDN